MSQPNIKVKDFKVIPHLINEIILSIGDFGDDVEKLRNSEYCIDPMSIIKISKNINTIREILNTVTSNKVDKINEHINNFEIILENMIRYCNN